jgi:hypothetical protein
MTSPSKNLTIAQKVGLVVALEIATFAVAWFLGFPQRLPPQVLTSYGFQMLLVPCVVWYILKRRERAGNP